MRPRTPRRRLSGAFASILPIPSAPAPAGLAGQCRSFRVGSVPKPCRKGKSADFCGVGRVVRIAATFGAGADARARTRRNTRKSFRPLRSFRSIINHIEYQWFVQAISPEGLSPILPIAGRIETRPQNGEGPAILGGLAVLGGLPPSLGGCFGRIKRRKSAALGAWEGFAGPPHTCAPAHTCARDYCRCWRTWSSILNLWWMVKADAALPETP